MPIPASLFLVMLTACGVKEDRVATLETQVAELTERVAANTKVTDCVQLRIKAMRAWTKHRPGRQSRCHLRRGVCRDTGLPPRTMGRYRSRLGKLFEFINSADYEAATMALDKLVYPIPVMDKWYEGEAFNKEEYIAGRDEADAVTRQFLSDCAGVLSVPAAVTAQPEGNAEQPGVDADGNVEIAED